MTRIEFASLFAFDFRDSLGNLLTQSVGCIFVGSPVERMTVHVESGAPGEGMADALLDRFEGYAQRIHQRRVEVTEGVKAGLLNLQVV